MILLLFIQLRTLGTGTFGRVKLVQFVITVRVFCKICVLFCPRVSCVFLNSIIIIEKVAKLLDALAFLFILTVTIRRRSQREQDILGLMSRCFEPKNTARDGSTEVHAKSPYCRLPPGTEYNEREKHLVIVQSSLHPQTSRHA